MPDSVLAWHFLSSDRHTRRELGYPRPILVEVGQSLTEDRPLKMCKVGLHASVRALDALQYAPGPVVCRVRLEGEVLYDKDKLCASERTVLAMADASAVLHEFACWCADEALYAERGAGREPDPRSWAAVEAKRAWLKGEIGSDALDAASAAASAAAWAAAWAAAMAAAWAAARAAAWDAAWDAAEGYTKRDAQNSELETRLLALLGIGKDEPDARVQPSPGGDEASRNRGAV